MEGETAELEVFQLPRDRKLRRKRQILQVRKNRSFLDKSKGGERLQFPRGSRAKTEEIQVPKVCLNDLFDREGIKKIDLLALDIEGHELEALAGLDLERFSPELIVAETGFDFKGELTKYLTKHGYQKIQRYEPFDEINTYYCRKQEPVDADGDGIPDSEDNCPNHANGPNRGTCTQFDGVNWIVSTKQFCTVDADCDPGELCEKIQADNYPLSGNGIGDACDCESDFLCDGDVDSDDMTAFLDDFGREPSYRRCGHPTWGACDGDFNCDVDVDSDDVEKFLEDFGREASFRPCPPCDGSAWCAYP